MINAARTDIIKFDKTELICLVFEKEELKNKHSVRYLGIIRAETFVNDIKKCLC